MDHYEVPGMQIKRASVLQSDELFPNRIISRNSSVGCSSRVYYYRSSEGVPFQWEMQPGTPKDPPKQEVILPPLSPPPAVISLGLPKPCVNEEPSKPPTSRPLRLRFWRRSKKNKSKENGGGGESDDKDDHKAEFCSSDCEFMASPSQHNSSSSSSSSRSFSNGFYRDSSSSRLQSPARETLRRPALSCSPWNVSAILINIARRV